MAGRRRLATSWWGSRRWRQIAGWLLATLMALVIPSAASSDHVDVLVDLHWHAPVTRAAVPLVDQQGHPVVAKRSTSLAVFGPHLHAPATPALLSSDMILPGWLLLLGLAVGTLLVPVASATRLVGQRLEPIPPPPRL